MKISDILKVGREIIANPKTFTRYASARDADDELTLSTAPEACRWCSTGVLQAMRYRGLVAESLTDATWICLTEAAEDESVVNTNNKSRASAVAMWDRAIAKQLKKEAT